MERNRKQKLLLILILITSIASVSVGFAAFTTTLSISSSASVSPNNNTFGVKFSTNKDKLVVEEIIPTSKTTGITTTNGIIDNSTNPTIKNLSATFTEPGQYVEYNFYARNEGEYTAYLNSVNFMGEKICTPSSDTNEELAIAACESIRLVVYIENEAYTTSTEIHNHQLEKGTSEQIKIILEYVEEGIHADGAINITYNSVGLLYSTIDAVSVIEPPGTENGISFKILYNEITNQNAIIDSDVDFKSAPITGVYIRETSESQSNPIYYYRGNVTNNNVIFADYCWKIVRTTSTGGIKLVYNGIPTGTQCMGVKPIIAQTKYNTSELKIEDVSYLYEDGSNSLIKNIVDNWYNDNLKPYESYLEDIPWYNDRSVATTISEDDIRFSPYIRNASSINETKPIFDENALYKLMVSNTDINNKLMYPIALLTADELTAAGSGWFGYSEDSYLNAGVNWWTMSPDFYNSNSARNFYLTLEGRLVGLPVTNTVGARPAISLKSNTKISSGDGTSLTPYIVN